MNHIFSKLFVAFFIAITLNSCMDLQEDIGSGGSLVNSSSKLVTDVNSDLTIKGIVILEGIIRVTNNATLTIEPGTLIVSNPGTGDNALVILKDGIINAVGTAEKPIVFTSSNLTPGDWGGITIVGDAPIVASGGATSAQTEGSIVTIYGGSNATQNSGTLKYVRVEFAGKKIGDGDSENNGFSFYAVGSGTTLDHLVSYKGTDDGFEFYGGTVNATNLISYGNTDDSFDWQDSWRGTGSNWFAYQVGTANFGMEIDASNNVNAFGPSISNITLRRAVGTITEKANFGINSEWHAIQFKKGGNGTYSNVLISGYDNVDQFGVLIQDATTRSVIANNSLNVSGSFDSTTDVHFITPGSEVEGDFFTNDDGATGATMTAGAWSTASDSTNTLANL